jgi:uncharacterized membrane protein
LLDDSPVNAPAPELTGTDLNGAAPSTTGLDPAVAAALAYLAGPFSAIIVLLAERSNAFVKFHAWQSIIGLGLVGAAVVGLLVAAFAALVLFSPTLFTWLYKLAAAAAVVWLILWAMCLVKAFSGSAFQLPFVGTAALRRALRR